MVFTISASIRMSRQLDPSTWATVELGGEASVQDEQWQDTQALLYLDLRKQLALLWKDQQPPTASVNGHSVNTSTGEITDPICPAHNKSRRSTKFKGVYCPTKIGDGKYCTWNMKDGGN